jgi:hypothetical protein
MITNDQMTQLRLLELRKLITDKEVIIQNMIRENNLEGWLFDWNSAARQIDEEITNKLREVYGL